MPFNIILNILYKQLLNSELYSQSIMKAINI